MKEGGKKLRFLLFAVLVICVAACGDRNAYVPPPPPKVMVSQPLQRPVTDYLEFTGNVVAYQTVPLQARVEGYLEKVLVYDGQYVKNGQLLFLIQQNTYEAKLKQAQASLMAEKAQLEHAETEYRRYAKLVQEDAAAQTDVDRWRYERDSRRAAVLAAEAQVELARLNLSYTRVVAPFDGRMGRHLKDPGTLVGAGEKTLLAEINQIDPIYVYFNINEQDLLRVRGKDPESPAGGKGKEYPVQVALADETDFPHAGQLDFAAISLNPTTGSLMLRAILANPRRVLLPGMFARVRVPIAEQQKALLVPEAAISFDQIGPYLRVVNDKNLVERRGVKLGVQDGSFRAILEGLQPQDWVVVTGMLRAIPGREVTPERITLSATAPPAPESGERRP